MMNKLNGTAKWIAVVISFATVSGAAAYKHATAVSRMGHIEVKHESDVEDMRGHIEAVTALQAVMREEQIRQGRILERVAAKVGADPN